MIQSSKPQFLLIALTLVNLCILAALLLRGTAAGPDGVIRGRGLQIMDSQGKVRASIAVYPATRQPDGSTYPETVLLRLITAEGRPIVKIPSAEDGAAMALSAAQGPAHVQILSRGGEPRLSIVDKAGRQASTLP